MKDECLFCDAFMCDICVFGGSEDLRKEDSNNGRSSEIGRNGGASVHER